MSFRGTRIHTNRFQDWQQWVRPTPNCIYHKLHDICASFWIPRRSVQQKDNHECRSIPVVFDHLHRLVHEGKKSELKICSILIYDTCYNESSIADLRMVPVLQNVSGHRRSELFDDCSNDNQRSVYQRCAV